MTTVEKRLISSSVVTPESMKTIEEAVHTVSDSLLLEKEDLRLLKDRLESQKQEINNIANINAVNANDPKIQKQLYKMTNKMTNRLDKLVMELNDSKSAVGRAAADSENMRHEMLKTDELIEAVKKIEHTTNKETLDAINGMLSQMGTKGDGTIRLDTLIKLVHLIGRDNIHLNKEQMSELIDLIKKEEMLTIEDSIEKTLLKHQEKKTDQNVASEATASSAAGVAVNESKNDTVIQTPTATVRVLKAPSKEEPKSTNEQNTVVDSAKPHDQAKNPSEKKKASQR